MRGGGDARDPCGNAYRWRSSACAGAAALRPFVTLSEGLQPLAPGSVVGQFHLGDRPGTRTSVGDRHGRVWMTDRTAQQTGGIG